jgi:hypothetical protein
MPKASAPELHQRNLVAEAAVGRRAQRTFLTLYAREIIMTNSAFSGGKQSGSLQTPSALAYSPLGVTPEARLPIIVSVAGGRVFDLLVPGPPPKDLVDERHS